MENNKPDTRPPDQTNNDKWTLNIPDKTLKSLKEIAERCNKFFTNTGAQNLTNHIRKSDCHFQEFVSILLLLTQQVFQPCNKAI